MITTTEITNSDTELLNSAAYLVSEYSWGQDYPVKPLDEILSAEYRIGATKDSKLIGFGSVGRSFSPDGIDNDELWLAHAVVEPHFRNQGLFKKIYNLQMSYAQQKAERILSCTDNPIVEKFFLAHGWKIIRKTKDESGEETSVFEYTMV